MGADSEQVSFTFEGRRVPALRGQSLASALMASGTSVLGRSFKYRRPRGYTCGYDMCGNCQLTVNGLPGVSACVTAVHGGEEVRRERGRPTADHDVWRVVDPLSRFISAGFQFRLFRNRPRLAHLAEKVMARFAGAGRLPTLEAADATRTATSTSSPDVLVVGGGLSGCAAALGAASAGASVLLVHHGPIGGRACVRPGSVSWAGQVQAVGAVVARVAADVIAHPNVEVVQGTALAWFEDGVVPIVAGRRLLDVHPRRMVVATGSYDVPALFPGNDKPGVVLADGVSKMLYADRVVPWRRAVVLTDCERGHLLAGQLEQSGVEVVAVVHHEDTVPAGVGGCGPGHLIGRIDAARGRKVLGAVDVRVGEKIRTIPADLLCVALRERPADELVLQWQYVTAGTPTSVDGGWSLPAAPVAGLTVVGSAAGWPHDDPERAQAEGAAVAKSLEKEKP